MGACIENATAEFRTPIDVSFLSIRGDAELCEIGCFSLFPKSLGENHSNLAGNDRHKRRNVVNFYRILDTIEHYCIPNYR